MSYDTPGQRNLPMIETPAALMETLLMQAIEEVSAAWMGLAMGSVEAHQLLWGWLVGGRPGL